MTSVESVLAELDSLASEQIQRIYARRAPDAFILGVRFGDMGKLTKRIKCDSGLARGLWESGSFEARHVACAIIDPVDVTEREIDRWVEQVDVPLLSDSLAEVVYRTPFADAKRRAWMVRDDEFVRRAGYTLLSLAANDPANPISDDEVREALQTIEQEIHGSANWAREMMNYVPIAIGRRSPALYEDAVRCALGYGKVDVFHGDKTNCKVTDALRELTDPPQKKRRKAS